MCYEPNVIRQACGKHTRADNRCPFPSRCAMGAKHRLVFTLCRLSLTFALCYVAPSVYPNTYGAVDNRRRQDCELGQVALNGLSSFLFSISSSPRTRPPPLHAAAHTPAHPHGVPTPSGSLSFHIPHPSLHQPACERPPNHPLTRRPTRTFFHLLAHPPTCTACVRKPSRPPARPPNRPPSRAAT